MIKTKGIHHISITAGHAQRNLDFYAGVLGFRLVKQTLNYDDYTMYHLYFGNHDASSNLYTTFPMKDAIDTPVMGAQVALTTFAVAPGTLNFWKQRLHEFGIKTYFYTQFNRQRLGFSDLDGLSLELVEFDTELQNQWAFNGVGSSEAISGIESAQLISADPDKTLKLLTDVLGYQLSMEDDQSYFLKIHSLLGGSLELSKYPTELGKRGMGVHHIAFAVGNDELEAWYERLKTEGYHPTRIKNRKYFKSIYFREPGGILIELATEGPGMTIDESVEQLGQQLLIPEAYLDQADETINELMPLFVREVKELTGYGYRNRFEYELLREKGIKKQQYQQSLKA